jgi:hypothetical protein
MDIYSVLTALGALRSLSSGAVGNLHLYDVDIRHIFKCMDMSGCQAEFTAAELSRFVDKKTLALRDKLASGEAIREASSSLK